MNLRDNLGHVRDRLAEVEEEARKLENKNFADIIKSAHSKISQAMEHPDLEKVGETRADDQKPLPLQD